MGPEQLTVVYHACCGWEYRSVIPWQLDHLAGVGLKRLLVTHVGADRPWLLEECHKRGICATIEWSSPNLAHYETPANFLIERLAGCNDTGAVLYLHTKGVTNGFPGHRRWRELMHIHLIEHWRDVLGRMDEVDLAGVNWQDTPPNCHFAGNFQMMRWDWVRKLPSYADFHNARRRERFSTEMYWGQAPNPRVLSLFCRNVYYTDFVRM